MTLAKAAVVGSMLENKVTQLEGKRRIKCIKQFWEASLEREVMASSRWFPFLVLFTGYLVSAIHWLPGFGYSLVTWFRPHNP